jgi:hypothetical protein
MMEICTPGSGRPPAAAVTRPRTMPVVAVCVSGILPASSVWPAISVYPADAPP